MNSQCVLKCTVRILLLCLITIGPAQEAIAADPLKVRIYSSVTVGVKDKHAIAFTRPMLDLLARKVDYDVDLALAKGETSEELLRFGQRLNDGEIHLGVIWGLEYGWLKQRFPRLEVMLVTTQGVDSQTKSNWPTRLMVREDFQGGIEKLKGKTLATFKRSPLMNRLFLNRIIEENGHKANEFFDKIEEERTPKKAIIAVRNGEAHCVVVDVLTYIRHVKNSPKLGLVSLVISEPFPEPVIVGRLDRVKELRTDLWRKISDELQIIHRTAEGEQCCVFWRMDGFVKPEDNFYKFVRERVSDYPLRALYESGRTGRRLP